MNGHANILFDLFIVFASAKIAAEVFERLKQPAIVGEILVGVLIGPSVLGLVKPSFFLSTLSEIGVIFLLFTVGLEIDVSSLLKVGKRSLWVALGGVILPFFVGWGFLSLWGASTLEGVFLGAALVATSVGITARVLSSMNQISHEASQIILTAAVIDDLLGLLVLSGVSSLAKGEINLREILFTAAISIGFVLFMLLVATRIVRSGRPALERLRISHAFFILGLILCFGFSWLATLVGVAAIIGAFLAGIVLAEISEETPVHSQANSMMEFLVPFFLVGIGLQLDVSVFKNPSILVLSLIVTAIAVLTKLIGCGFPALSLGRMNALRIGIGMVPRGEVGIIVAQIGLSLGVLSSSLYGVVVFMAIATTLIAPPFLKMLFKEDDDIDIRWSGKKPRLGRIKIKLKGNKTVSDMVLEDRR